MREDTKAAAEIKRLMEGNLRFSRGLALRSDISPSRRRELRSGQKPFAAILGCSDSRVPPEIIFDCGLGDLFIIRTAGHTADGAVLESLQYCIEHLKIHFLVVLGHEHCGAVSCAIEAYRSKPKNFGGGTFAEAKFESSVKNSSKRQKSACGMPASIIEQITVAIEECGGEIADRERIEKMHIRLTAARLAQQLHTPPSFEILGAYYSFESGLVEILGSL